MASPAPQPMDGGIPHFDIDLPTFQDVSSQTIETVEREMKKVLGAIWFLYKKKLDELISARKSSLTNRITALQEQLDATSDPDESQVIEELITELKKKHSRCRKVLTNAADSGEIESLNAFHEDAKRLGLVLRADKHEAQDLSKQSIANWLGPIQCGTFNAWNSVDGRCIVSLRGPWV